MAMGANERAVMGRMRGGWDDVMLAGPAPLRPPYQVSTNHSTGRSSCSADILIRSTWWH